MANYVLDTPHPVEAGLTVNDLFKVLRRRRNVGLIILGACVLLTLLYCLTATRRYTATGIVQVQKEGSTGIDVSDITGGGAAADDPMGATVNLETQAQILQSDTLALNVIRQLNLEKTYDFQPHFSIIGSVLGLFASKGVPEQPGLSLEDSPHRRTVAVKRFEKNLTVKVVTGTRLIQVDYSNPDPKIAASVVNHLIQGLTDYSFETKTASSSEASTFLQSQLSDLRKQSEDDQAKLAALQKDADLFSFGTDSTGHEQLYSDVLDKLQQSTAALSAADQNRIVKEAVYRAVKSGNAELISELSGTGATAGTAMATSLNLIQNLRLQQSTLEQQIAEGEQKYGTAYPRMTELHAQLNLVNKSLSDEIARVAARAKNDYDVAQSTENQLRAQNDANHRAADELKDKAVDYTILREEANQSRTLYEDLLKKLKETGVLKGLKDSELAVVDPGRVPDKPSKPNTLINLIISVAVGLLFGFGGMLVAEGLDGSIHSTGQIEKMGIPLIGILPKYGNGQAAFDGMRDLRTINAPKSAYSEAVRSVRATLVPAAYGAHRVIVVTSPNADEGKSLTARNLAVSVAQQGKRVVLVDADFRSNAGEAGPDFKSKDGLATLLVGPPAPPSLLQVANLPSLFLLPSGAMPGNPAELLSSPRMKLLIDELRAQFDLVLIDSPPVLPVVDALLLSEMADSTLLVARYGVTDQDSLARAYQLLASRSKPDSVAVVLNGVSMNSDIYRSYFGTTTAHYYQEDAHEVA
jgi:capsular exopolysaccharide synthesis family protein